MKNAEPARDIVRRNNSIRDLAWDRLTRDVGRERGDRMRKIKKGGRGGERERRTERRGGGKRRRKRKQNERGYFSERAWKTQAAS